MPNKLPESSFVFISSIIGNILEYYDFTVYTVFASVIGRTFFPESSPFLQMLSSLGVFAVGFLTRPIGGILFGYIGDVYGRRRALLFSMLGITIPTCIIGLLPSYAVAGVIAPIVLVIMRLIQGLCISGEGTGAAIFILEHHQHLRPGLTASLVNASNIIGTLLATLVGMLINNCYNEVYAWRLAFLWGGVLMGVVGFYLRLRLVETPIFKMLALQKQTLKTPFLAVVKSAWRAMLVTFCIAAVAGSPIYLVKSYVIVYYQNVLHIANGLALNYMFYTNLIVILTMPLFGGLADWVGVRKAMVLTSIMLLLGIFPTLYLMSFGVKCAILPLTLLGILAGAAAGPAYLFAIALFKPEQRFSGVAFSYNLGVALLGSTTPVVAHWLVAKTDLLYAPAFYVMAIAMLFLITYIIMSKKIETWMCK